MSRIQQTALNVTAANLFSGWLRHDHYEAPFNVSLGVYFGSGLNATIAVQFIIDDVDLLRQVSISQATTVITVVDAGPAFGGAAAPAGHGLAVGDFVQLTGTPGGSVDGGYNVATVVSATSYTLTAAVSQTLPQLVANVGTGRVFTHATLTGLTARANGNYAFPVWGSRLTSTAFTAGGFAFLVAMQGSPGS